MARVYLESTDTSFVVASSNTTIYGASGDQVITISSGVTGVAFDQNAERVAFGGASSDYKYAQAGNQILVYSSSGVLIASIPTQGDSDGTRLTFTNGTANAILTSGVMKLGGTTITGTSTTPAAATPTTIDESIKSTSTGGTGGTGGSTTTGYSIAASTNTVTEGSSVVYTVTRTDTTAAASLTYNVAGDSSTYTAATAGTDFTPASGMISFTAGTATASFTINANTDSSTEGLEGVKVSLLDSSNAVMATTTTLINDNTTTNTTGSTYYFTSGVDTPSKTAYNDTYIADNSSSTKQLSVADQIDGGSGTDTLKIYIAAGDTTTSQPSLTSIENVYINGGAITSYTAASGTTGLSIDSAVENTAATYTLSGQTISFANFAVTANTITTIASATDTTENITLNGFTRSSNTNTLDLKGSLVTSASIATTGAASIITLANTGAALASLTVTGDKALTLTESLTALKTINASAMTAAITVDASGLGTDNTLAFTGGSGNDKLTFAAGHMLATDTINGGSGTDTIVISDTTPVYAALNAYTSIEKLALKTTGATVDVSQLTSIGSFEVGGGGLNETFNNSKNTSTYKIINDSGTGTIAIANAVGQNTTTVNIDNQSTAAQTLTALTVSTATTVNLSSTGVAGSAGNVITDLNNADNSSIVITGDKALTITNALDSTPTGTGSSVDASAFTAALTVVGSALSDVIKGGTAADVITGGVGADTLTGGAGADKFYLTTGAGANLFVGSVAATADMDKITDFVAGTDKIGLINGTTPITSVNVTGITVSTAADVTTLLTGIGNGVVASAGATQEVGLITVSAGAMAGTYLLINDGTNAAAATDTLINITGVSGSVSASDFIFA